MKKIADMVGDKKKSLFQTVIVSLLLVSLLSMFLLQRATTNIVEMCVRQVKTNCRHVQLLFQCIRQDIHPICIYAIDVNL